MYSFLSYEFVCFLLFSLNIMWGILLTCAILQREPLKWILSVQMTMSIIYALFWVLAAHLQLSYSAYLAINNLSWGTCALCFFTELFLLAYQYRHRLSKRLCALSVAASLVQVIAHLWIGITMAAWAHC